MDPYSQLLQEIHAAMVVSPTRRMHIDSSTFHDIDPSYAEEFQMVIEDSHGFSIENLGNKPLILDNKIIIDPFSSRSFPSQACGTPYIGSFKCTWGAAWDPAPVPAPQFKNPHGAVLLIKLIAVDKEVPLRNVE